jgi:hypothetical protein
MRQVREADNLATFKCQLSRNCDGLNFLQPKGLVQALKATALPFSISKVLEIAGRHSTG